MGYQTTRGLPVPFGFEGNNVPADLFALAQRLDDILSPHTYVEIGALGGVDLWDGRTLYQSDTGALRPFAGLYAYKAATAAWQILIPRGSASWTATLTFQGTAPTPGTGMEQTGRYARFGTLILGQFVIFTGTAGFSAPASSAMNIDLPPAVFPSSGTPTPVGFLSCIDGAGAWTTAVLHAGQTTFATIARLVAYKGGGGATNAPPVQTMPAAWGNNVTMFGSILYDTVEQ